MRPGLEFKRLPGFFATTDTPPSGVRPSMVVSGTEGKFSVCRAGTDQVAQWPASAKLRPVYALSPSGPLAVPTGLVFVRFSRGVLVKDKCDLLASVGYEIARSVPYAPNAAWVRARSGHVADALNDIGRLATLQDVENVEPQLVTERVHRDESRPSVPGVSYRSGTAAPRRH